VNAPRRPPREGSGSVRQPSGALVVRSRRSETKAEARGKRETVGKIECDLRGQAVMRRDLRLA